MESKLSIERRRAMKNRLEEIRKERGIKQEELAAALERFPLRVIGKRYLPIAGRL